MTACLRMGDFQGYLEGDANKAPVEVHVAICAKCRAAFDRIAATQQTREHAARGAGFAAGRRAGRRGRGAGGCEASAGFCGMVCR